MKLQLKRSNVLDGGVAKEPTAVQMEYGELAVNYNDGDPAIFLKDSNDNIIRIAGSGSTGSGGNPSGPLPPGTGNQVGDLFFDTTNEILLYWNGSEWVPIASNATAADIFVGTLAEIDAAVPEVNRNNGFLWWNTEDGTLYVWYKDGNTDQWVIAIAGGGDGGGGIDENDFVKKSGDTMIGALNVPAGATTTEAPQIQEVVQKNGDTMTGMLTTAGVKSPLIDISSGGTTFDLNVSPFFTIAGQNVAAPQNQYAASSGLLMITAAPGGTRSWDAAIKHPGGTWTEPAAYPAIVPFFCDGTNLYMGLATEYA